MPQILFVACCLTIFQLDWSNALLVILISDYDLLLEKTISQSPSLGDCPDTPYSRQRHVRYR